METVNFTRMEDGTAEEYAFLEPLFTQCSYDLPSVKVRTERRWPETWYGSSVLETRIT